MLWAWVSVSGCTPSSSYGGRPDTVPHGWRHCMVRTWVQQLCSCFFLPVILSASFLTVHFSRFLSDNVRWLALVVTVCVIVVLCLARSRRAEAAASFSMKPPRRHPPACDSAPAYPHHHPTTTTVSCRNICFLFQCLLVCVVLFFLGRRLTPLPLFTAWQLKKRWREHLIIVMWLCCHVTWWLVGMMTSFLCTRST